jgi:hypothetical protein
MSAVANIVLNDALGTPVAHTFIPLGPDAKGVWWWEDQSGASPIAYNRIAIQLTRPGQAQAGSNSGERVSRVKVSIYTPQPETLGNTSNGLTPPDTIAYVNRVNVEFSMPERGTLQNRKDLRKYAQFLMADSQLVAMVEALQSVY